MHGNSLPHQSRFAQGISIRGSENMWRGVGDLDSPKAGSRSEGWAYPEYLDELAFKGLEHPEDSV